MQNEGDQLLRWRDLYFQLAWIIKFYWFLVLLFSILLHFIVYQPFFFTKSLIDFVKMDCVSLFFSISLLFTNSLGHDLKDGKLYKKIMASAFKSTESSSQIKTLVQLSIPIKWHMIKSNYPPQISKFWWPTP